MPAQLLPAAAAALALLLLVLLMKLRRRSAATRGDSSEVRALRLQVETLNEALRLARETREAGPAAAPSVVPATPLAAQPDLPLDLSGEPAPDLPELPPELVAELAREPEPLETPSAEAVTAMWDRGLGATDTLGLPAGPDAGPVLDEAPTQEPLLQPDEVVALTEDVEPVDVETIAVSETVGVPVEPVAVVEAPSTEPELVELAPLLDVEPVAVVEPVEPALEPVEPVLDLEPVVDLEPLVEVEPLVAVAPPAELEPLAEVAPLVEPPLVADSPFDDLPSVIDVEPFGGVAPVIQLLDQTAPEPYVPAPAEDTPTAAAARAQAYATLSRSLAGAGRMREAALAQWAADLTILAPLLAGRGAEMCRTLPTIAPTDAASAISAARAVATAHLGPAVGPAPSLTDTAHLSRSPEDTARPYRAADVSAELLPDHLVQALEDVLVTSAADGGDHAGVSIGLRCDLVAHLVPAQPSRDPAAVVREVLEPHERPLFDDALARTSAGRAS